MGKIFKSRELKCEKDRYDKNLRCKVISNKGRETKSEKDIDHAFIIRKPSERGDNLEASSYADENRFSSGFFNKKCAFIQVKPIRNDEGKILIESRKEAICSDSTAVLKKFIKENEGYF